MSLLQTMKTRALEAMKAKDSLATQILRLAVGELQTLEARIGRDATEDEAFGVVKKLIKSNEETIGLSTDAEQKKTLETEVSILKTLLPATLGVPEIAAKLEAVRDDIVAAKSEGQATGVAMKLLKSQGASVNSADVMAAIKQMRGT